MPPNNTDSGKADEVAHIKLPRNQDYTDEKIFEGKEKTYERCKKVRDNGIAHSKSQTNMGLGWQFPDVPRRNRSVSSLVDELLCDIYSKLEVKRRISATTCDLSWQDSDHSRSSSREVRSLLQWVSKDADSLKKEKVQLERLVIEEGNKLVKHLKRKNILIMKREAHYDVITAYIQAISTKTSYCLHEKFKKKNVHYKILSLIRMTQLPKIPDLNDLAPTRATVQSRPFQSLFLKLPLHSKLLYAREKCRAWEPGAAIRGITCHLLTASQLGLALDINEKKRFSMRESSKREIFSGIKLKSGLDKNNGKNRGGNVVDERGQRIGAHGKHLCADAYLRPCLTSLLRLLQEKRRYQGKNLYSVRGFPCRNPPQYGG